MAETQQPLTAGEELRFNVDWEIDRLRAEVERLRDEVKHWRDAWDKSRGALILLRQLKDTLENL